MEVDLINPVIGITCGHQWENSERYYVNTPYINAIIVAGGIPILIPYMSEAKLAEILKMIDGLLIPGGIDIDAKLFNQELHPNSGLIDPWWDQLDLTMILGAMARQLPILAICRGCQILNVAYGGTIIQDIDSQVEKPIKHQQQAPKWYGTHLITITKPSLLQSIMNTDLMRVNSFHHQAVDRIASGFKVSAVSSDGIIEAIESCDHHFVLGLQWHPELMVEHYPEFKKLFSAFVLAASATMEGV